MTTPTTNNGLEFTLPPKYDFAGDARWSGYSFSNEGVLGTPEKAGFDFAVYDTHAKNQYRYEQLGEVIEEYVYALLEANDLKRVAVPVNGTETKSFVFTSPDFETNTDKLAVIIHGSGVVRAGQWARSLIINDSLTAGTIVPYVTRLRKDGYAILVTNTNLNRDENDVQIAGSASPRQHACTVWDNVILPQSQAKSVTLIAHSYGAAVSQTLLQHDSEKLICCVGLTDGVMSMDRIGSFDREWIKANTRNWVSSSAPLDTKMGETEVSAGHPKHEYSSHSCISSLLKWIRIRLKAQVRFAAEAAPSGSTDAEANEKLSPKRKPGDVDANQTSKRQKTEL